MSYDRVEKVLPLLIVEDTCPSLFGCNRLMHFLIELAEYMTSATERGLRVGLGQV